MLRWHFKSSYIGSSLGCEDICNSPLTVHILSFLFCCVKPLILRYVLFSFKIWQKLFWNVRLSKWTISSELAMSVEILRTLPLKEYWNKRAWPFVVLTLVNIWIHERAREDWWLKIQLNIILQTLGNDETNERWLLCRSSTTCELELLKKCFAEWKEGYKKWQQTDTNRKSLIYYM